ncbi:MAG: aminoglycoside phosphotransferase family protein [Deltaproteobacteria bacterium]|nr:aminoglycoside phosphotransferase family protein [Deltaproteobacteria bacterium]
MRSTLLPSDLTAAEFDALAPDDARWRPAAGELFSRHGHHGEPRRLGGTALVYALGGAVLKLLPPVWAASCDAEVAVLERVHGRLGVPSPELLAVGSLEGWRYFLARELQGRALDAVWPSFDCAARERASRQAGELLARLHAVPPPEHPQLTPPGGWRAFLTANARGAVDLQRARGLGGTDLAWLEAALPTLLPAALRVCDKTPALLHTELGPGHLLAREDGSLCGVLDFGDALVGPPDYDLVAAGLFVARGDPSLFRALAEASGCAVDREALLALTALHRYAHLPWYLRETGIASVEALAGVFM